MRYRGKRRGFRAITPAIGAMLVLSISLACAFILGAFSFGLMAPNIEKTTLTTGRLTSGVTMDNLTSLSTSSLYFELNNQGATSNITSLELTQNGWNVSISEWSVTRGAQSGNSLFAVDHNLLPGGRVTPFVVYPIQSTPLEITVDETYLLTIDLSNGQMITSYLVAQ